MLTPSASTVMLPKSHKNLHILVVDDNASIHEDFKKILKPRPHEELGEHSQALFDSPVESPGEDLPFEVDSAMDGYAGLRKVEDSFKADYPYAIAFVDVRMPGGMGGIELVKRIWDISPDTQIVMCTAHNDVELKNIWNWAGKSDQLLILKKPFDNIEVLQLAHALTTKWELMQTSRMKMMDMTNLATERAQKLQHANAILETEIEQHKLTARSLDEARRLAEAALAARRAFLANMSHEIRTPLNGIMGMNELLLETKLNPEQKEYALNVVECSQSLLGIISDILDFAKIDSGQLEIENEEFDLNLAIEDTIGRHRHIATRMGLKFFEFKKSKCIPRVCGDAYRLQQILDNLLANATKFTHQGSIIFELTTEYENEHEINLRFTIKDTGVGIEPGMQGSLFQPFIQADNSTTRDFGGTGLGLAICKNLVRMMRGHIDFESEYNRGSSFWFTLPLQKAKQDEATNLTSVTRHSGRRVKGGTRAHILVAEDSPIGQAIVRKHLELLGCETTIVENGRQAVEAIEKYNFDLVFLDCQMPEMSGFEAACQIRKMNNKRSQIPIVALTASDIDEARDQCIAANMDDFLLKPVSRSSLRKLLDSVLV